MSGLGSLNEKASSPSMVASVSCESIHRIINFKLFKNSCSPNDSQLISISLGF